MKTYKNWLGRTLLAASLLCTACSEGARASSAPLVSAEDRKLLEEMKAKKAEREAMLESPWLFVVSGEGNVATFDKGIINTYTEIRGYPLHNLSRFDVVALEAEVTMLKADDSVLATVPVRFKGGLLAGETKVLEATSPTVQGDARKFMVRVTKVTLHSE